MARTKKSVSVSQAWGRVLRSRKLKAGDLTVRELATWAYHNGLELHVTLKPKPIDKTPAKRKAKK